jgi:hypothetical protein
MKKFIILKDTIIFLNKIRLINLNKSEKQIKFCFGGELHINYNFDSEEESETAFNEVKLLMGSEK